MKGWNVTIVSIGFSMAALAGGAGGCATKNVDVVNDTGAVVRIAQVESPRVWREGAAETVVREASLAPGERLWLTVKAPSDGTLVPRLRAEAAGTGARAMWIDLPVGGAYVLTIGPDAPGGPMGLRLEALAPAAQGDASERQRREIIDRPPSAFDRSAR